MKSIIELAKQAGFGIDEIPGVSQRYVIQPLHWKVDDELTRFAALVRAAALEEAAGVCDREAKRAYQNDGLDDGYESGKSVAAKNCADAIRQLKETK